MPLSNQLTTLKGTWKRYQQCRQIQPGTHVQEEVLPGECSPSPILLGSPKRHPRGEVQPEVGGGLGFNSKPAATFAVLSL